MNPGDRVCYSKRHHDWLVRAYKWPSPHVHRNAVCGSVITSSDSLVTVRWESTGNVRKHFEDNLEVM